MGQPWSTSVFFVQHKLSKLEGLAGIWLSIARSVPGRSEIPEIGVLVLAIHGKRWALAETLGKRLRKFRERR